MSTGQSLVQRIEALPPNRRAEVEDFIEFLATREDMQNVTRAAAAASVRSFATIWNNGEDDAYDEL